MVHTKDNDDYDYLFKVVVIGDGSVGKSNLLTRFTRNEFVLNLGPTIGVEFASKNVILDSRTIKVQVWDTAGQERFRSITEAYYRKAVGALLVYDITRKVTFENLDHWFEELRQHAGTNTISILVGNKSDLDFQRQVPIADGQRYAEKNGMAFMETSALDSTNVEEAFKFVVTEIYHTMGRKIDGNKDNYQLHPGIVIPPDRRNQPEVKKQSSCC